MTPVKLFATVRGVKLGKTVAGTQTARGERLLI